MDAAPTPLSFDTTSGRFYRDGRACPLEPKCARLLRLLAASPGQVVSQEQIREEVWDGRLINAAIVAQVVLKLRRALGDDGTLIRSVRHRGYVLTVPLGVATETRAVSAPAKEIAVAQPDIDRRRQLGPAAFGIGFLFLAGIAAWQWISIPNEPRHKETVSAHATDPQRTHALARSLALSLTPSALGEADRLLVELSELPAWEAIANADLARVVALRYRYDGTPFEPSLLRAQLSLARAVELAPNSDETKYAQAVVAEFAGDLSVALKYFDAAQAALPRIPGFAADWANAALRAGELQIAIRAVEAGLQQTPAGARLLLVDAWLAQLTTAPRSSGTAASLIDLARAQSPGMLEVDSVAIGLQLQLSDWQAAAVAAERLRPFNAQDRHGLALAIVVVLHLGKLHELPGLLRLFTAADSGGDGSTVCTIWETWAQVGKPGDDATMLKRAAKVPESTVDGLWLRAYLADARLDRVSALRFAQRAFAMALKRDSLIDLTAPDFSIYRLAVYQSLLQTADDQIGLQTLKSALAAKRRELLESGLRPDFARRLTLAARE